MNLKIVYFLLFKVTYKHVKIELCMAKDDIFDIFDNDDDEDDNDDDDNDDDDCCS